MTISLAVYAALADPRMERYEGSYEYREVPVELFVDNGIMPEEWDVHADEQDYSLQWLFDEDNDTVSIWFRLIMHVQLRNVRLFNDRDADIIAEFEVLIDDRIHGRGFAWYLDGAFWIDNSSDLPDDVVGMIRDVVTEHLEVFAENDEETQTIDLIDVA